jgi:hypothetical protein
MDYGSEKDRLICLRNRYIRELNQLKTKFELSSTQRKKNVKFNRNIEKIDERGNISQSSLSPEEDRPQCACSLLECTLEGNQWKCTRKKEYPYSN